MNLFSILTLIGGLALFLYGMNAMGDGLAKVSGGKLEKILENLTSNPIKAVLLGAGVTAVIQSSSATTVMVVGFVNSGIMKLSQAVGVIMGANIGTTITSWILSLTGIQSDNFIIQMFKPTSFSPVLAIIGVIFILFINDSKKKDIGTIFIGFAILMYGMDMMSSAVKPLAEVPEFTNLLLKFSNPLLGVIAGALLTAVIQSSSASVGILQALASTGMIPLSSAVFVLFGQNIGTCITAVLASIGMKVNAKRTTVIHLLFNIIGAVLFTVICLVTPYVTWIEAMTPGDPVAQIANAHTVFNIVTTLLLLPFGTHMANIAVRILPDSKKADDEDLRLKYIRPFESSYAIGHSAVAVSQVRDEVNRMRDMVAKNISDSFDPLVQYDEKLRKKVSEREEYIDFLNKGISEYIVSLMASEMNMSDSRKINGYYAIISNLERIGDHAVNLAEYGDDMRKWEIDFSDTVKEELNEMKAQCIAALDNLKEVTSENVERILSQAVIIEQKTDDMRDKYFKKQMQRLKKGKCKPQSGIVFSEILTDFERMGDHALNIAQQYREME